MNDVSAIQIEKLCFGYPGHEPVFNGLDFELRANEKRGLIGPTGCGKTTLLHLMVGLLKPDSGAMRLFGRDCRTEKDFAPMRRRIGLVFQDPDDQLFCPTVIEDLMFGPLNLGLTPRAAQQKARDVLAQLGLTALEQRITYKLSGGEKRLVSLAAVLTMEPNVLLLDEPTNGLDEPSRERLLAVLKRLTCGRLVVSHDRAFLDALGDPLQTLHGPR